LVPLLLRVLLLGFIFAFPVVTPIEAQLSLEDTLPGIPEVVVQGRDFTVDEQAGLTTFRVDVHVPADHHGYLDRGDEGLFIPLAFAFDSLEEGGFRVTEVSRPSGTRDDIVHATVLRESGVFEFWLEAPDDTLPPIGTFSATLRHQICNDVTNICYPPKSTIFPLRFADGAIDEHTPALANITQQSAPTLTLSERLTALFRRHFANFPMALLLVFLAGLIASATPCVYPVIPITSAILMARGGGARRLGQLNALVYFLGITFFFTLLGIFAATTGTALSALMTSAWANLAFAGIFAYFGLSMIGFYEFQFLTPLIAKLDNTAGRWDGFFGTFLMGTTAGLVISPCVGPIAGAILLDITGQAAGAQLSGSINTAETTLRGIGLMASFGMGLGIPFLVVGMLSNGLPQSGPWLTKVKFLLGIPILYFAYVYYLKGMETAAVPPNIAHAILVGILAIALAVFLGLFHSLGNAPPQGQLVRRVLGIILLILGVHFLYNGLGQSGILIPVSRTSEQMTAGGLTPPERGGIGNSTASQVELSGNLRWLRDFSLAQERARIEGKPLFVDFYATWCANCKAFQRLAENNAQLNNALQQAVLVKIYDTDEIFGTFQRDENYPELGGVGGQPFLPLFAIYSDRGDLHWKGQDYRAVTTIVSQIEAVKQIVVP
jgi:thiol:disulfide interchange protein DsbD